MNRRDCLLFSLGLIALGSHPATALASTFWDQPRKLWLKREVKPGVWEEINEVYFEKGGLRWTGYVKACRILRDIHTGKAVQMSPVLMDILAGIQGWFSLHDIHVPIIVLSGLREAKTNEDAGGVKDSAHLRGGACDLTVPGVPVEYLSKLALYLQGGGVGVYPSRSFIHVDDGKMRSWRG